jgi:hypothetical protein
MAMRNLPPQSNPHDLRLHLALPKVQSMSRELRMAAHQVEIDAILALCHHTDGPFRHECEACAFRQQVCIEHLQRIASVTMWCLSGTHTSCMCVEIENE